MRSQKAIILSLIAACLLLCSCSTGNVSSSRQGIYFDTVVSVEIYGAPKDSAGSILDACMDMCDRYQKLFDKNTPSSDIAKINSSDSSPVKVDHETALMLDKALAYSDISDVFDITIAPVYDLWDFHEGGENIPDDNSIGEALTHVGHNKITVDIKNDTVTSNGAKVDAGGAAKGYIADMICEYLLSCQISGAIVDMGGDMRIIGTKPDGSLFNIGINDPFSDGIYAALTVSDRSVATSGTYERCFTKDGTTYHHILDPHTGYPADTDITSVTVICDDAIDADCLCTLSILLGSNEALKLIEDTDDTEAVFILNDKTCIYTSGAGSYVRQ